MRVITLDVGNTTVDLVLWEEKRVLLREKLSHGEFLKREFPEGRVICLSVRPSLNERIREKFGEVVFVSLEDIPLRVHYRTPETLGVDRVVTAYGGKLFYGENLVLVSAGTALVVDLLLRGEFRGGFITLGISRKLRALTESAEKIPPLSPLKEGIPVGFSTEECVARGVVEEALLFVRGLKERWESMYGEALKVIVTGGEGELLSDIGTYDPLLAHRALLEIYRVSQKD